MYLRKCCRSKGEKEHIYWELVESYRTERGPRQRVVTYLGDVGEGKRLGVRQAAKGGERSWQSHLFDKEGEPEWVEIDAKRVRVERVRDFGSYWLGLELAEKLGLIDILERLMPEGREEIPWPMMALTLVLMRLSKPSSELRIAEHLYERSCLGDLLGISEEKVNDDRLYRALDRLLPQKVELEKHLKERLGELFDLEYDLLLYDVTSTYFEGQSDKNPQAKRGYSRDHRPDCKQVCIALVVSRDGVPLGYEVFAGNRTDVTTVEEIVEKIEDQYGSAGRIWVMDRGMVSEENLEFLRAGGRRYIVGTPKSQLKRFEKELLVEDWEKVRDVLRRMGRRASSFAEALPVRSKRSRYTSDLRNALSGGWRSWWRVAVRGSRKRASWNGGWGDCSKPTAGPPAYSGSRLRNEGMAGLRWSGKSWRNGERGPK
ncbi:MAG: IS1634 family transposase [Dehalococcoidia bacterium]